MTITTLALVQLGALWLAWRNGANDNFKGVAALHGRGAIFPGIRSLAPTVDQPATPF